MPKTAIFTIVQDEGERLPLWLEYYAKADVPLFVLNHDTRGRHIEPTAAAIAKYEAVEVPVHNVQSFSHEWLRDTVAAYFRFLLSSFTHVLFTEVDEFVVPDPASGFEDLRQFLKAFDRTAVCCNGYEVVQQLDTEAPMDWTQRPLLQQRSQWYWSRLYSKPILSAMPLTWDVGFHQAVEINPGMQGMIDPHLLLLHTHKIDYDFTLRRNQEIAELRTWSKDAVDATAGFQNRLITDEALRAYWTQHVDYPQQDVQQPLLPIPDAIKAKL